VISFLIQYPIFAQDYHKSLEHFQTELNEEFKNLNESPLSKREIKSFEGLPFFPIDEKYKVMAKFERTNSTSLYQLKTTANTMKSYDLYGIASFEFHGKEWKLNIYQSHQLRVQEKYKDYLFLPFTDQTNGAETYGGGRYIDLSIPEGERIEIDFNKAYNPFCAYNGGYACPIPPKENDLALRIEAGVKK
jgi:hypothetical protein